MSDSKPDLLPPAAYVNFLRVSHQPGELFLAFGQVPQNQGGAAHLVSSLVTTPARAKAMLFALAESVRRYEEQHGAIALPESPSAEGGVKRPAPSEAPGRKADTGSRKPRKTGSV